VERTIHLFGRAGALCAREGLQFGYHNHDWELTPIEGVVPYDLLLERTDPEQVTFQLDAYWIRKGGGDLFDYLQRFPGRFSSCHMKDIDDAGDFADVGDGNIDFPRFTREAMETGARYFFVERDNPPDPLASAKRSYEYLRRMTF
jgi:sugar phosphate isomerase/epimerase